MDNTIKEIINEIAEELDIPKVKVKTVVYHFFNWQRQKFIELENECYYWKYFGKFKIIPSRYEKWKNKQSKEFKDKTDKLNKTKKSN